MKVSEFMSGSVIRERRLAALCRINILSCQIPSECTNRFPVKNYFFTFLTEYDIILL